MNRGLRLMLAVLVATASGAAWTRPAEPAEGQGVRSLDTTAEITLRRLPTCETAIRTRVSEWKAQAAIACKKPAGASEAACVDAQLKARAEQLKRLRSCRFF